MIPGVLEAMEERIRYFRRPRGREHRLYQNVCRHYDLQVVYHKHDIANLADVGDAPLWDCEMPWPDTDDGFT